MNGAHDLGGMHGFGPVEREENEPVFHAPWEGRVLGLVRVARARKIYNVDESRWGIERIEPARYLRSSYYERWLASLQTNLIEKGVLSREEIETRLAELRANPDHPMPQHEIPGQAEQTMAATLRRVDSPVVPGQTRFKVGDAVISRRSQPAGHTRLPRYARGRRGVINLVHGVQVLPDSSAQGGDQHEVLYNVRFEGAELWGESSESGEAVLLDLWESYLEPA